MRRFGVAADRSACYPKPGEPTKWCNNHKFPKDKSFGYSVFGSREAANMFAHEVAARGQYFYTLFLSKGDKHYKFTAADIASFPETPEFTALAASCTDKRQLKRVADVRGNCVPRIG